MLIRPVLPALRLWYHAESGSFPIPLPAIGDTLFHSNLRHGLLQLRLATSVTVAPRNDLR